jgi:hypothetical protein
MILLHRIRATEEEETHQVLISLNTKLPFFKHGYTGGRIALLSSSFSGLIPNTPSLISSYSAILEVPSQISVAPFAGEVSTRQMFRAR